MVHLNDLSEAEKELCPYHDVIDKSQEIFDEDNLLIYRI